MQRTLLDIHFMMLLEELNHNLFELCKPCVSKVRRKIRSPINRSRMRSLDSIARRPCNPEDCCSAKQQDANYAISLVIYCNCGLQKAPFYWFTFNFKRIRLDIVYALLVHGTTVTPLYAAPLIKFSTHSIIIRDLQKCEANYTNSSIRYQMQGSILVILDSATTIIFPKHVICIIIH